MLPEVAASLECPSCRAPLALAARSLRCRAGHTFDVARSGYVNLLAGRRPGVGDTAAMIAARGRFLGRGHLDPLSERLAGLARAAPPGLAVELGAGTGRHLSRVVEASPGRLGLAVDVSPEAARACARAHPRVSAIVADTRRALPVAAGAAAIALVVFAPRNGAELRRLLTAEGLLLVATPLPEHLAELRGAFELLAIDARKDERLEASLSPWFTRREAHEVRFTLELGRDDCHALVAMGPSAFHLDAAELAARTAALPERTLATAACRVERWDPR